MEEVIRVYDIKKMKAELVKLAKFQTILKNQRKTKKLEGDRLMEPDKAAWEHSSNRVKLSIRYVAYGVMRGKNIDEEIKAHISKKSNDFYLFSNVKEDVEKLISKYELKISSVA